MLPGDYETDHAAGSAGRPRFVTGEEPIARKGAVESSSNNQPEARADVQKVL